MKILVVADVQGDFVALGRVMEHARKEQPDAVVCPGNLTDMFKTPKEFSQIDIADMVLQKLLSLGRPVLCVPGNHDPYETLDLFDDYGVNLHAKEKRVAGRRFIGFGGAQTPFNTLFEPTEEETADALAHLPTTPETILVVHNPPKDTKMDLLTSGQHVGSKAVREFIEKKHPTLALTAHIHEAAGEDWLGATLLFNPGPALEGNYGVVSVQGSKITCRRLNAGGPR